MLNAGVTIRSKESIEVGVPIVHDKRITPNDVGSSQTDRIVAADTESLLENGKEGNRGIAAISTNSTPSKSSTRQTGSKRSYELEIQSKALQQGAKAIQAIAEANLKRNKIASEYVEAEKEKNMIHLFQCLELIQKCEISF